jgi:ABC-2 type transport system ATP-binding protein
LLRDLAAQGRTVFLSSHLMSEMALTADHILVIGRGRILADTSTADMVGRSSDTCVTVRSPYVSELSELLRGPDVTVTQVGIDHVEVRGVTAEAIGDTAAAAGIALHELRPYRGSLEDSYLALTADAVEYQSTSATA